MKKIVYSTIIVAAMASMSVFGQGYMTFLSGSGNGIFDIFTTPSTPTKNANMQVGFIWAAGTGLTLGALGASGTPTAAFSSVASPWSSLTALSGGWTWGTNAANSLGIFTPTAGSPPPAAGVFNGGVPGVLGSSASEGITIYIIAWNKALGTDPYAAAAASSAIGWSAPFNYTLGSSTSPGGSMASSFASFGVDPVPEPTTLALAGLGGLALLLIRRRK
jgi:hypothetical protein